MKLGITRSADKVFHANAASPILGNSEIAKQNEIDQSICGFLWRYPLPGHLLKSIGLKKSVAEEAQRSRAFRPTMTIPILLGHG